MRTINRVFWYMWLVLILVTLYGVIAGHYHHVVTFAISCIMLYRTEIDSLNDGANYKPSNIRKNDKN